MTNAERQRAYRQRAAAALRNLKSQSDQEPALRNSPPHRANPAARVLRNKPMSLPAVMARHESRDASYNAELMLKVWRAVRMAMLGIADDIDDLRDPVYRDIVPLFGGAEYIEQLMRWEKASYGLRKNKPSAPEPPAT